MAKPVAKPTDMPTDKPGKWPMHRWIALLRGVNVGGRGRIEMGVLRRALAEAGYDGVRTLIQSGNIVLGSPERRHDVIAGQIGDVVERGFGFRPAVVMLALDELRGILSACPFEMSSEAALRALHFYLAPTEPTSPDLQALRALATNGEEAALVGRTLYLHAPNGVGRSKLVPKVERHIAPEMTGRNLNTIKRLLALAISP